MKAQRVSHGHSHSGGLLQEHDHEPVPGLPEAPPPGERILWQGAPDWASLARDAFHVRKVAAYFLILLIVTGAVLTESEPAPVEWLKAMAPFVLLSASALLMLLALAWLSARHTLYTITNRRVVMRIGIVLTVTFNIPFSRIVAAHRRAVDAAHDDLALQIASENRIPWLQLWPHARAWQLKHPQPTLRSLKNGTQVAQCLSEAWSAANGQRAIPATTGQAAHVSSTPLHAPAHGT